MNTSDFRANHELSIINGYLFANFTNELDSFKELSIPYKLFSNRDLAIVAQVIEKLRLANKPFDELTVDSILRDKGYFKEQVWVDILSTIAPIYATVEYSIKYIIKKTIINK
jgi:replicative DNA helicase